MHQHWLFWRNFLQRSSGDRVVQTCPTPASKLALDVWLSVSGARHSGASPGSSYGIGRSSYGQMGSASSHVTCVCAMMVCLRSGARCVSVSRGSFAFWPAAWGCSDSSDLIQVSTSFIAATQLNQVCLLLCSPVRPTAGSTSIFYCLH